MSNDSLIFSCLIKFYICIIVSGYLQQDFLRTRLSATKSLIRPSLHHFYRAIHPLTRVDLKTGLTASILKSNNLPYSSESIGISIDADDDPYLQSLNSVQRSIVAADLKNIRVQAGPGSGKTR